MTRGGKGARQSPAIEPVREDVDQRGNGKAGGCAPEEAKAALNQPAEESLLDRAVDRVEARLEPRGPRIRLHAQRATPPRQLECNPDRRPALPGPLPPPPPTL